MSAARTRYRHVGGNFSPVCQSVAGVKPKREDERRTQWSVRRRQCYWRVCVRVRQWAHAGETSIPQIYITIYEMLSHVWCEFAKSRSLPILPVTSSVRWLTGLRVHVMRGPTGWQKRMVKTSSWLKFGKFWQLVGCDCSYYQLGQDGETESTGVFDWPGLGFNGVVIGLQHHFKTCINFQNLPKISS